MSESDDRHFTPENFHPGGPRCQMIYQAWLSGLRDAHVEEHADSCWWCRWIIHGENTPQIVAVARETLNRIEGHLGLERARQERRHVHRRWFIKVAAGVIGLTVLGLGGWTLRAGRSGDPSEPSVETAMKPLDRIYRRRGLQGIQDIVNTGSVGAIENICRWIPDRQDPALYPILVGLAGNASPQVRSAATAGLLTLPPVQLQGHLSAIQTLASLEPDSGLQLALQRLVTLIQNS